MSSIMLNSILLSTSLLFFYILPILFHWSSISTSTCLPSLLPFLHFFTGKFQNKLQTTYHFICKYFSTSFIRKRLFFFFKLSSPETSIFCWSRPEFITWLHKVGKRICREECSSCSLDFCPFLYPQMMLLILEPLEKMGYDLAHSFRTKLSWVCWVSCLSFFCFLICNTLWLSFPLQVSFPS